MEKQIIGRGLLAGAVAGVLAFVFAKIFLEPVIGRAIDFEDGTSAAHEAMEAATRRAQPRRGRRAVQPRHPVDDRHGLRRAAVRVAMGALFAVVFAVALRPGRQRLGPRAVGAGRRRHVDLAVDRPGAEVPAESAGDQLTTPRSSSARCCTC